MKNIRSMQRTGTRTALLAGASLLNLAALLAAAPAHAQDAQPTVYSHAYRYDGAGRLIGEIAPDPDGTGALAYPATRISYNALGLKVKIETGELSAWQPTSVSPNAWPGFTVTQTQHFAYDTLSQLVKTWVVGSDGQTVSVTQTNYDRIGRAGCTAVRMNPATFAYPPASACHLGTAGSHGADRITQNVYDDVGRLIQVQRGLGTSLVQIEAAFGYSPNGKRTSVTDANNNRAEMRYDGFDRQTYWYFPSKTTKGVIDASDYELYGYDANGNRTSLRKRDGRTISFAYDALNRVTAKTYPQGGARSVHYGYDLLGLQTYARFDHAGGEGVTNVYDGFGRLTSATTNMDGVSRTLSHLYDANGNRTRITHPDGAWASYDYDAAGRSKGIYDWAGGALSWTVYNAAGRLDNRSFGWGANGVSSWQYDGAGRTTWFANSLGQAQNNVGFGYSWNPASQIATLSRNNDLYAWTDHQDVTRGYSVNGLNQYTAVSTIGSPFSYDANGNLTSDGNSTYSYDIENRLVSASGATTAQLRYDPLGRLYETSGASGTTRFLYDGDALVAEYNGSGTLLRRYVHAVGTDTPLVWYEGAGAARRWLWADHQGSIFAVTDGTSLVHANSYDSWGIPGASNGGRFQYTGQAWIPELRMYHYKARIYSPTLGRFLQTDPIGYDDRINLYAYVSNDPINKIDPNGLYEVDVHHALTMVLARAAGMSPRIARQISAGNQGVDDNPATSPLGMTPMGRAARVRSEFHFTSAERRDELWANFTRSGRASDLGVFLHAEQDSYSHAGYGPSVGHLFAGHAPDKTYNDVAKANAMARDTYGHLVAARERLGETGRIVPWDRIESSVNEFNAAETDAEKYRILRRMDRMIVGYR